MAHSSEVEHCPDKTGVDGSSPSAPTKEVLVENIIKAIESSQHCQRNWDLDKTIDPEHLEIFKYVLKTSPSKQNIAYYKIHFIFNRDIIAKIYDNTPTRSRIVERHNPQVLANLLVVFEEYLQFSPVHENTQIKVYKQKDTLDINQRTKIERLVHEDRLQAIGITSGQLVLVANYLGYKTGFCRCYDSKPIKDILNLDNNASLIIGIGHPDIETSHSIHHIDRDYDFKQLPKVDIPFSYIY